jgi:hypothetical protein
MSRDDGVVTHKNVAVVHAQEPSWKKNLDAAEAFRQATERRRTQLDPEPPPLTKLPELLGTQRLSRGPLEDYPRITVSVPVRRTPKHLLRRAVNSILHQSYKNVLVIVTSDGEGTPSWAGCDFTADPRVVCWTTRQRLGPYFAHEVARRAAQSPLFAVQDADDWSDPQRLEKLLKALRGAEVDAALPSVVTYPIRGEGETKTHVPGELWDHYWLIRDDAVSALGGYWSGFVAEGAQFLAKLVRQFGLSVAAPDAYYHCQARADSLSRDPGLAKARDEAAVRLRVLLEQVDQRGLEYAHEHLTRQAERKAFVEHVADLKQHLLDHGRSLSG